MGLKEVRDILCLNIILCMLRIVYLGLHLSIMLIYKISQWKNCQESGTDEVSENFRQDFFYQEMRTFFEQMEKRLVGIYEGLPSNGGNSSPVHRNTAGSYEKTGIPPSPTPTPRCQDNKVSSFSQAMDEQSQPVSPVAANILQETPGNRSHHEDTDGPSDESSVETQSSLQSTRDNHMSLSEDDLEIDNAEDDDNAEVCSFLPDPATMEYFNEQNENNDTKSSPDVGNDQTSSLAASEVIDDTENANDGDGEDGIFSHEVTKEQEEMNVVQLKCKVGQTEKSENEQSEITDVSSLLNRVNESQDVTQSMRDNPSEKTDRKSSSMSSETPQDKKSASDISTGEEASTDFIPVTTSTETDVREVTTSEMPTNSSDYNCSESITTTCLQDGTGTPYKGNGSAESVNNPDTGEGSDCEDSNSDVSLKSNLPRTSSSESVSSLEEDNTELDTGRDIPLGKNRKLSTERTSLSTNPDGVKTRTKSQKGLPHPPSTVTDVPLETIKEKDVKASSLTKDDCIISNADKFRVPKEQVSLYHVGPDKKAIDLKKDTAPNEETSGRDVFSATDEGNKSWVDIRDEPEVITFREASMDASASTERPVKKNDAAQSGQIKTTKLNNGKTMSGVRNKQFETDKQDKPPPVSGEASHDEIPYKELDNPPSTAPNILTARMNPTSKPTSGKTDSPLCKHRQGMSDGQCT